MFLVTYFKSLLKQWE